jgi:hypothetical protein
MAKKLSDAQLIKALANVEELIASLSKMTTELQAMRVTMIDVIWALKAQRKDRITNVEGRNDPTDPTWRE